MKFTKALILVNGMLLYSLILFSQKIKTGQFEKVKGKLPFPVCSVYGYSDINCVKFSKVSPAYKNITFITDSAADVRAIYNGKVYRVFTIENDYAVVTKFENYFITYYPLKKPAIKKGDTVVTGQPISKLDFLDTNFELNILISKDDNFIDPFKWFRW